MPSKFVAFGLVALACVAAAAAGAYVAVRQNPAPLQPAAVTAQPPLVGDRVARTKPDGVVEPVAPPKLQPAPETPKPAPVQATPKRRPATPSVPQAVPAQPAIAQPSVAQPEPALPGPVTAPPATMDQGATAPPKPWPNSGGTEVATGTPQPPVTLPPPVESTPVGDVREMPPAQVLEELVVPTDAVLGLQLQTTLSSTRAQVEDPVDARVTRDVRVGDRIAIPAGARVLGSVVQVERGGKVKERAHLAIRFHTLVLADSTRLSISTDAIHREGESPANKSAARIGGAAVGGAILGAIIGGGKGAAIGGAIGAAGGTGAVMAGDRMAVTIPSGTLMTVRILAPVTVTVQK